MLLDWHLYCCQKFMSGSSLEAVIRSSSFISSHSNLLFSICFILGLSTNLIFSLKVVSTLSAVFTNQLKLYFSKWGRTAFTQAVDNLEKEAGSAADSGKAMETALSKYYSNIE